MEFHLIGNVAIGVATQPTQLQQPIQKVKKPRIVVAKSFDFNCTISIGTNNIDIAFFQNVQSFIKKECVSRFCSIERGDALQKLYFEAVFRIVSSSPQAMSKLLKTYLGWEKGQSPPNSHILVKKLKEVELHTYIGMIGYCVKDKGEQHFDVIHNNITKDELEAGIRNM